VGSSLRCTASGELLGICLAIYGGLYDLIGASKIIFGRRSAVKLQASICRITLYHIPLCQTSLQLELDILLSGFASLTFTGSCGYAGTCHEHFTASGARSDHFTIRPRNTLLEQPGDCRGQGLRVPLFPSPGLRFPGRGLYYMYATFSTLPSPSCVLLPR